MGQAGGQLSQAASGRRLPEGDTTDESRERANLSKQYFIRIRGTVRGPFPPEKLKELARRGQFSRVHHVSVDGVNWEPAANHPELLPEPKAVKIHKRPIQAEPEGEDSGYQLAAADQPAAVDGTRNESPAEDNWQDRVAWYYASAGRQFGPVSFAELRQLASRGALQYNAPVWAEGMSEWSEAANVPGLFAKADTNIYCPYCKNLLKVTEKAFGKTVPCPICQQPIAVPSAPATPSGLQRQESGFPEVTAQGSGWSQEGKGRRAKITAVVAGGVVGLLFLVVFATWAFMRSGPTDAHAPKAGFRGFEPTDAEAPETGSRRFEPNGANSPEAGCAACGTVMAILVVCSIAILVLNIALLVWVARDAKARGMDSAVVWMLLVMFTGLLGLLIYIFSRPQGNVLPCPTCGNKRLQASARCPHCGNP